MRGGDKRVQYGSSIIYLGGDIIVSIKGEKVAQYADLYHALVDTDPGDIVEVVVIRDGVEKIIKVELTDRPSQMEWMVR